MCSPSSLLKRLSASSSKMSAADGEKSSFGNLNPLWLANSAILTSHGFLIMCWNNLRKPQRDENDKLMDLWHMSLHIISNPPLDSHILNAYLSRLLSSLAVIKSEFGIICLNGCGRSVGDAADALERFPFVQPREYWNVCAAIWLMQQNAITNIIIDFDIFNILYILWEFRYAYLKFTLQKSLKQWLKNRINISPLYPLFFLAEASSSSAHIISKKGIYVCRFRGWERAYIGNYERVREMEVKHIKSNQSNWNDILHVENM